MELPDSVRENLQFLCVEVDSQVARLQAFLEEPSQELAATLLERAGYATNLRNRIRRDSLELLSHANGGEAQVLGLRSAEVVAEELESICALCRDCVGQVVEISDTDCLELKPMCRMLQRVRRALGMIDDAMAADEVQVAMKIATHHRKLDRLFERTQKLYVQALGRRQNTEDLVRALFVTHCVERMGDALVQISESLVSATLGQPVSLERMQTLHRSVAALPDRAAAGAVHLEKIAETRSGSSISGVARLRAQDPDEQYLAILKEGGRRKLREERDGVESWHQVYPGIAPRVISFKKHGRSASMLIEHLPGLTVEEVLLQETDTMLEETFSCLAETVQSVWRETRRDEPANAGHVRQLEKRFDEVCRVHPEFRHGAMQLCGARIAALADLLARARDLEAEVSAPYSVYIHGDFNVDNVLYDPEEHRIGFIDLHRSRYTDYVQDVSVFMVSNYRLQVLDRSLRRRVLKLALDFYAMARRHARKTGDSTFELRMALGLARSFVTSTRFILDKSLSRSMFLRGRYLLERVAPVRAAQAADFKLPAREIFVG